MNINCPFCHATLYKIKSSDNKNYYNCVAWEKNLDRHSFHLTFTKNPIVLSAYDLKGEGINIFAASWLKATYVNDENRLAKFLRPKNLDLKSWLDLQAKANLLVKFQ